MRNQLRSHDDDEATVDRLWNRSWLVLVIAEPSLADATITDALAFTLPIPCVPAVFQHGHCRRAWRRRKAIMSLVRG